MAPAGWTIVGYGLQPNRKGAMRTFQDIETAKEMQNMRGYSDRGFSRAAAFHAGGLLPSRRDPWLALGFAHAGSEGELRSAGCDAE
jgi:hypothetical protein